MNQSEILRYLGGADENDTVLAKLIEDMWQELDANVTPGSTSAIFDKNGLDFLLGSDIHRHLEGCDRVILFAATLGVAAEKQIIYRESISMEAAVVMDACATEMLEEYCDEKTAELESEYSFITGRFSPGYGNFPIRASFDILKLLDAGRKIGLYMSQGGTLIPGKSVTAVIGVKRDETTVF